MTKTAMERIKARYDELEEQRKKAESNLDELVIASRMSGMLEAINIMLEEEKSI